MKKKLIMLSLAVISCVCLAFGVAGCSNSNSTHTHTLVMTSASAATCTEAGHEAYWTCADSSCGKMFSDAEGKNEITAPVTIAALGHSYTTTFEWTPTASGYTVTATRVCSRDSSHTDTVNCTVTPSTTAATCTAAGSITYTATATFSDGEGNGTDTKTDPIPATGHTYDTTNIVWTWSADYGTATAAFACTSGDDTQTVTATVTPSTTAATCTVAGSTVYTATATFDSKTYTDTKTVTIPATGHTYDTTNVVWTWNGTASATAAFTCTSKDDTQTVTATITDAVTTEPTATENGTRTYTATVTFEGKTYTDTKTEVIAATGHTYDPDKITWAWGENNATATATIPCTSGGENLTYSAEVKSETTTAVTCTTAGEMTYTATITYNGTNYTATTTSTIAALGHSYGEATWAWTEATEGGYTATATFTCSTCNDSQTVSATVTSKTTAATCTVAGSTVYTATATFEGKEYTATKEVEIPATGHTASTTWTTDGTSHWHVCTVCNEVIDKADHTGEGKDGKYVCSTCGYELGAYIGEDNSSLSLGDTYIYLASSNTTYYSVTFAATKDGTYTFTISSDCQAQLNITDIYGNSNKIGITGYGNDVYTVSLDMDETYTYSINISAGDSCTFTDYVFCLTISCEEKEVAAVGESTNPYPITDVSVYGSESVSATVDANSSYYFTIAAASDDTLVQLYFLQTNSLELYDADGNKLTLTDVSTPYYEYDKLGNITSTTYYTYSYYYFCASTTAITFCLKNTAESAATVTINAATWSLSLSSTNELTISSAWLNSSNAIVYSYQPTKGNSYKVTLGDGTDSNVAVYYLTSSSSSYSSGTKIDDNYPTFTSTKGNTVYFAIVYSGTDDTFTVNLTIEKYVVDDEGNEYTTLTLDEAVTATATGSANVLYYTYTPATSGTYVLTLTSDYDMWTYLNISLALDGTTISGAIGTFAVELTAGTTHKLVITVESLTTNITVSTVISNDSSENSVLLFISETEQAIYGGTVYAFVAPSNGNYTFSVGSSDDVYVTDGSTLGTYDLYNGGDGESDGGLTTTISLTAGDVRYIYCYDDDATCSITITYTAASSGGDSGDNDLEGTYTLDVNETQSFTVTVAGFYTFTVDEDADCALESDSSTCVFYSPEFLGTWSDVYTETYYLNVGDTFTITTYAASTITIAIEGTSSGGTTSTDSEGY